ncbi:MAG: cysteine hydrolase, partial [Mesorhizobium sp.]
MIKATPFDFPYDGRLVPQDTALLVIDLQEDFLSPTGYFARKGYDPSPLRAILPTVNRLIAAARAGLAIVHTRQGYRADMADMTAYEKWRRKRAGLDGTDILLRSSPGFQIVADIEVRPEDIIVDKTCNGAFTYTDLELVLRARGITHLMFTGCTTDVCVHTTLR